MNLGRWQRARDALYARLSRWCGTFPERGALHARELWRREYATHTEVKLTYEGEPGERIPAYLLIPRVYAPHRRAARTGVSRTDMVRPDPPGPLPAVYAAHQCAGQCDIGKEQVVGKCADLPDQAYGLELVREGFVVLAPDANKVGERYDPALRAPWERAFVHHPDQNCCCTAPGGSWGPVRWKPVYDVMRGIDLLCELPYVDCTRIGMIGHSLGADTTIWAMPFEPRIRAAAISGGGLMVDGDWLPYGLPYEDVLRLIAPRPYLEITGAWDDVNWKGCARPDSVREAFARKRSALSKAREAYAVYGQEERLGVFEFAGGHTFTPAGRQAAYAWLKRWLA